MVTVAFLDDVPTPPRNVQTTVIGGYSANLAVGYSLDVGPVKIGLPTLASRFLTCICPLTSVSANPSASTFSLSSYYLAPQAKRSNLSRPLTFFSVFCLCGIYDWHSQLARWIRKR